MIFATRLLAVALLVLAPAAPVVASTAGEQNIAGYASTDSRGRQFARIVFDRTAVKPYLSLIHI